MSNDIQNINIDVNKLISIDESLLANNGFIKVGYRKKKF